MSRTKISRQNVKIERTCLRKCFALHLYKNTSLNNTFVNLRDIQLAKPGRPEILVNNNLEKREFSFLKLENPKFEIFSFLENLKYFATLITIFDTCEIINLVKLH